MVLAYGSRTQDLEFRWFTSNFGDGWETWRSLAAEWLASFDYGVDQRRAAITRFLEEYLVPNFITCPQHFFYEEVPNYQNFIMSKNLSDGYKVRQINEVSGFIDWIIDKEFSEPNDNGVLVPLFSNPISKESTPTRMGETVYSPLPYSYIQDLRKILYPRENGNFGDWSWAIKQTGNKRNNGAGNGRLGDWFYVDEALIDKGDPDCVWREIELDQDKVVRIGGINKSCKKGARFYQLWSPVRAMVLFLKLHIPLRTYQIRMLDSGESDTWRFEKGQWVFNSKHPFSEGTEKLPWQKGVFRRIKIPEIGDVMTGLYINTNKTADRHKEEIDRGYVIPWEHRLALYWLEKLRNWQEKYNPITERTSIHSLDMKHFGSTKTEKQREAMGDMCFLFRNASESTLNEKKKPISAGPVNGLWYLLLKELENRKFKAGETLSNNKKIQLTYPVRNKTFFPLHSLRVSLITCYAMEGDIPAPVLSKLLVGHSRLIMTLYYTKVTPSVMAQKMKEAEHRVVANEKESLKSFLQEAELRQIELNSICNHIESITSVLKIRNPAGWQEKGIGLCLVGGNTSRSEESPDIGGCWNGGERIKKATKTLTDIHTPVPHGFENCIRCRWFITDARYLYALNAHFNNLSYQTSLSAKLAMELEHKKDELLEEQYFCEEEGKSFSKHDELSSVQRRWERQATDADEYCKDMIACFQVIKKILSIEDQREEQDNTTKIVSVGAVDDIQHHINFFETESPLWQLIQVCDDAELYPDLSEDLKKSPAILDRSNILNHLLMHNGYAPVFMNMDEQAQLIAGNAMIRAMASQYAHVSESSGFKEVANYIEAQEYLVEQGLLQKGVEELNKVSSVPLVRLSDLNEPTLGLLSNE